MSDPTGDSLERQIAAVIGRFEDGVKCGYSDGTVDPTNEVIALVRSEVEPEIREKIAQEIEAAMATVKYDDLLGDAQRAMFEIAADIARGQS